MKKQLTYIAPLKAGIVMGLLYAILSLILVPFLLLATLLGAKAGNGGPAAAFGGIFVIILLPVLYAIGGFIAGIISSALYNLVAKLTGGLEFEVRDIAPMS